MRFCRFNDNRIGVVRGSIVHDIIAVLAKRWLLAKRASGSPKTRRCFMWSVT